jgi:hypothetical protein
MPVHNQNDAIIALAQVFVGKDLDDAVAFQLALGPAGEIYREAGKLAEEHHDEIAKALRASLNNRPARA